MAAIVQLMGYSIVYLYTPYDDKISQSGYVQGTNEIFVWGFFLNIGMCPGVKITMSRGCYKEIKCVYGIQQMVTPFHSSCPGVHCEIQFVQG